MSCDFLKRFDVFVCSKRENFREKICHVRPLGMSRSSIRDNFHEPLNSISFFSVIVTGYFSISHTMYITELPSLAILELSPSYP